jgi:mannitol/fructose-specific phosphotransferase system IIA component (Ntr-type)
MGIIQDVEVLNKIKNAKSEQEIYDLVGPIVG